MVRGLAVALVLAGCAPPPPEVSSAAITNGASDSADPAVAALLDASGHAGCSGTLVAPHVVLTAAHCGIGATTFGGFRAFFGSSTAGAGAIVDLADAAIDPAFDAASFRNDLALLTLKQSVATPLPIDPRTLDGTLAGQTLRAVGFGDTGPNAGDGGQKRSGVARVTAVGALDFTTAPAPSQPCSGDSGGPALFVVAGVTYVSGVTSHGDGACADHAVYARIDTGEATFVAPYLAKSAAGAAALGDRCFYLEHCAQGACLAATDDPRLSFCSRPCAGAADCPAPLVCAADGCRHPTPSPGALGAACATPGDCFDGDCLAAPGQSGACTRACIPTKSDCPSGFRCQNTGGITFSCVRAPPPSGCAMGGSPPTGGAALSCLLAAWLALRRRA